MENGAVFKSGIVALVGPANAGKSTLLNSIIQNKVSIVTDKPHTTRNRVVGILNDPTGQIVLYDTPGFAGGIHRGRMKGFLSEVLHSSAADVDIVALVVDSSFLNKAKKQFQLKDKIGEVLSGLKSSGVREPDVVVLNKIDSVKHDDVLPLLQDVSSELSGGKLSKMPELVPVSGLKGLNVNELVGMFWNGLSEGPAYYDVSDITDQAEEFFVSEIIREKVFERLRQELPYGIAVSVDGIKETSKVLTIIATIYVERVSHKSIVIGAGGKVLKNIGSAARADLEKAFKVHINLQLYVKVEEDWSLSEKGLRKVGYYNVD